MSQIKTVFGFTLKESVRKKSYIISTVIVMLLILVGMMLPRVLGSPDDGGDTGATVEKTDIIYYLDSDGTIEGGKAALEMAFPSATVKEIKKSDVEAKRKEIFNGEGKESIVSIENRDDVALPVVKVMTKDFMSGINAEQANTALTNVYRVEELTDAGASKELIAISQLNLPFEAEDVGDGMGITSYILSLLASLMMFFAITYYGSVVATSIATEKSNRVMETLIVSANPKKILIGKIAATGVAGLLQFTILVLFAFGCYKAFVPEDFNIGGMVIDFSGINLSTMLLILMYFLLGYTLYSVLYSVCGALVSKLEDLQGSLMPMMLITIASFYIGYIGNAMATEATFVKVATYVPFVTPFIAPSKVINGEMGTIEILATSLISVAAIIVVVVISMKVYSDSVLKYGGRTKRKGFGLSLGKKRR